MIKLKKLNPKVLLCTFGLIMVLGILFSFVKKTKENTINKTNLYFSSPVFKSDASSFVVGDTVAVIDYKGYSLYEFYDFSTFSVDTTIIETKKLYRYFLLKKKEQYGYYYDDIENKNGKKMRMDSILNKRFFYNQTLFDLSKAELIDSQKSNKGYDLIEKYKCKIKVDNGYDTLVLYYKKNLKNIGLSLSKQMDSIKKMKLQKINYVFNPQFIKNFPNKIPAYNVKLELKEDTLSNLEKYKCFIDEKINMGQ